MLVLLVVLVLQPAPAAFAEDTSDITWSVRPANQSGPDGRSWVELALDPGDQTTDYIAVKNFSDEAVAFKIDAADGYFTDAGRFDMLPPGEPSTGAGTWITVQDTVTVEPAATAIVPFVVRVPENAEPGDHAAGVAVSIRSEILDEDGARIGMESRVGFRVMTRVTGMIDPAVELAVLDAQYSLSWNPFSPGQASVTFEARNSGNARLLLHGTVDAAARSTSFPGESEPEQELLPGESRTLTVTVEQAWPLFLITGEIELTPAVVALDGSALSMDPTVEPILIWAIPWPQLMVCGGVLLLILGLVWGRTQSRRKTAKLVSLAREEGRRAALHDEGGA
ncbi:MAG: DUF916 domain-containing protein [Microbacterium sp.]|uniref:COG1470 family protein n=1 Tax=Microbacterium sp. TaxID=51671 RepID=UPI002636F06F|nr:DUF916 domain-containing protein [Microbacterium sp.]MCX6503268.1 DUF916 domain-containing protein [Microbacterium sp.]